MEDRLPLHANLPLFHQARSSNHREWFKNADYELDEMRSDLLPPGYWGSEGAAESSE